jgi:hypothetical protein
MMAEVEEKRSGRRGTGEYFAGAIEGKKRVELIVHCNAEQPRSLSSRWKREATPEFSRQEEKGIVELYRAEQFNLLLIPAFVPCSSAASPFIPSLPFKPKEKSTHKDTSTAFHTERYHLSPDCLPSTQDT